MDWMDVVTWLCCAVAGVAALHMLCGAVMWAVSHFREFNAMQRREQRRWARRRRSRADRGGEWIGPSDAIS